MTKSELEKIIIKYLPNNTVEYVLELLIKHKIQLKLTKPRNTKYGDYRHPTKVDNFHRISLNVNLNPYNFLITYLHEVAHLTTFEKYGNRVEPHGKEWKNEFKIILKPMVVSRILPDDINHALLEYIKDPSASTNTNHLLNKTLFKYDYEKRMMLEELEEGEIFKIETGKIFKKGKKLRTWFQCFEVNTNKEYRVSSLSKVERILIDDN